MSAAPSTTTSPQKHSESDGSLNQTPVVSKEKPFHKRVEELRKRLKDHRKAVKELERNMLEAKARKARREQMRRQLDENMAECRSAIRFISATLMVVAIAIVATPSVAAVAPGNRRLPQPSKGRGRSPRRTNGLQ